MSNLGLLMGMGALLGMDSIQQPWKEHPKLNQKRNGHRHYSSYESDYQSPIKESSNETKSKVVEKSSHVRAKKEHNRDFINFHNSRGKRPAHISKSEWKEISHSLFSREHIVK